MAPPFHEWRFITATKKHWLLLLIMCVDTYYFNNQFILDLPKKKLYLATPKRLELKLKPWKLFNFWLAFKEIWLVQMLSEHKVSITKRALLAYKWIIDSVCPLVRHKRSSVKEYCQDKTTWVRRLEFSQYVHIF